MAMKKHIIILFTTLVISGTGFAQWGTPMSQFSGNQIAYNPGYAGIYDILAMNLTVHQSWIRMPGAPFLLNANVHAPFGIRSQHAWGALIQSEKWGPLSGNSVMGNYAHKILLGNNRMLNFGVQAGVMIHTVDWDLLVEHTDDPHLREGRTSEGKFDVNAGVYYLAPKGYAGLTVRHITNPRYGSVKIDGKDWFSQMRQQFLAIAGYNFRVDNLWSIRPELFMRYVHTTPLSYNLGTHVHYRNRHSFGINYMSGQSSLSFQARTLITPSLRIGYSYDVHLGDIRPYQQGSHEISVNYMILLERGKVRTVDLLWL
jgi:type IX secretion system PorP/SprF family membrane protein